MAADIFMKVDGVKGESTDDAHKDEIEVLSYNFGITQPASMTASSAGGGTTGRAQFHDMTITKEIDSSSPKLKDLCATGKHINSCVLTLRRDAGDGKKVEYMKYTLTNSIVSQYSVGGGANGALPVETVGFNFGSIQYEYTPQKRAGGAGGGKVPGGFDLQKNKPV